MLTKLYSSDEIKEALRKSKELDPKTIHFCSEYFNLPKYMFHLFTVEAETSNLLKKYLPSP